MRCRALGILILTLPLLSSLSGCDNRPKYVLPSEPVPPAAQMPRAAGGGGAPVQPEAVAPDAAPTEKPVEPKEPPAESPPPEKKP